MHRLPWPYLSLSALSAVIVDEMLLVLLSHQQ